MLCSVQRADKINSRETSEFLCQCGKLNLRASCARLCFTKLMSLMIMDYAASLRPALSRLRVKPHDKHSGDLEFYCCFSFRFDFLKKRHYTLFKENLGGSMLGDKMSNITF